jgi:hypothetical protein
MNPADRNSLRYIATHKNDFWQILTENQAHAWEICRLSAGKIFANCKLWLADKRTFRHIAAARYRDLRLRGRRPSWAFPP